MTVLIAFLAVAAAPFLAPSWRGLAEAAPGDGPERAAPGSLAPRGAVPRPHAAADGHRRGDPGAHHPDARPVRPRCPGGPGTRAAGLLGGLAAGRGDSSAAFLTWEPAWQDGVAAEVVGALLAVALLAAAYLSYRDGRAAGGRGHVADLLRRDRSGGDPRPGVHVPGQQRLPGRRLRPQPRPGRSSVGAAAAAAALALVSAFPKVGRAAAGAAPVVLTAAGFLLPEATGAPGAGRSCSPPNSAPAWCWPGAGAGRQGPGRAGLGLAVGWLVGTGRASCSTNCTSTARSRWTTPT